MNDQPDPLSLDAHLDAQASYLTDRCTLCGKCVEVCPVVHEASPRLREAEPADVITGIVDVLKGGAGSELV